MTAVDIKKTVKGPYFSLSIYGGSPTVKTHGNAVSGVFRRARPATILGDHHTPTSYYHVRSSIKGRRERYRYYNTYNTGTGSHSRRLRDILRAASIPRAVIGGSPMGNFSGSYPPRIRSTSEMSEASANLKNVCLSRLRDNQIEIGAILAESLETANYLAYRTQRLASGLVKIKKGKVVDGLGKIIGIGKGRSASERAASAWLESRYAISPLIRDVNDLWKLSSGQLSDNTQLLVSASARKSIQGRVQDDRSEGLKTSDSWRVSWSCDIAHKLTGRIDDPELFAASQLGLDSVVSPVWELVPFSFVVDWIIPIGTYLNALHGPKALSFVGGYTSYKVKETGTYRYRYSNIGKSTASLLTKEMKVGSFKAEGYSRSAYTNFPEASIPSVEFVQNLTNVVDAIALLRVLRK